MEKTEKNKYKVREKKEWQHFVQILFALVLGDCSQIQGWASSMKSIIIQFLFSCGKY